MRGVRCEQASSPVSNKSSRWYRVVLQRIIYALSLHPGTIAAAGIGCGRSLPILARLGCLCVLSWFRWNFLSVVCSVSTLKKYSCGALLCHISVFEGASVSCVVGELCVLCSLFVARQGLALIGYCRLSSRYFFHSFSLSIIRSFSSAVRSRS